ncbi:unnamed protein product [Hermetia illucens]|uniref:BZIP domain-containing protein n=1 Tax=Hermetia illucens TaxID=343691 RepID=A0A7R8YRZ3_HERIL|nr:CCAAT/enhancer-binding protein gamma [Hermetia illucens]CAD7083223.1 unnamed protein product [Hermetia illucens]
MPPRRKTIGSSDDQDMDDDDYRKKRERNNRAVKLCREKSSKKAQETRVRVDKLKEENIQLEEKIRNLKKHVEMLKGLLLQSDDSEARKEAIRKVIESTDDD